MMILGTSSTIVVPDFVHLLWERRIGELLIREGGRFATPRLVVLIEFSTEFLTQQHVPNLGKKSTDGI